MMILNEIHQFTPKTPKSKIEKHKHFWSVIFNYSTLQQNLVSFHNKTFRSSSLIHAVGIFEEIHNHRIKSKSNIVQTGHF